MQILEGTIIDSRFRVLRQLGSGAMGYVFEAEQMELDRLVAIKFMNEASAAQQDEVARFQREGQVLSQLRHKNVVAVYALGVWRNLPYLVMERLHGRSLLQYLEPKKALDQELVLDIALQVCAGLSAAHAAGVVHRDIKPANIIIQDNSEVKIIDFGFAKLVRTTTGSDQQLTEVGTAIGTVLYMSPQQANGQQVDHRADIYALGAVIHHCLTGEPPFLGEEYLQVMAKQIQETAPRVNDRRRGKPISESLQTVIDNAMAKTEEARYQTVDQMRTDLLRVASREDVYERTGIHIKPLDKSALRKPIMQQKKPILIALSIFVVAAGVLFYFAHQTGALHSVSDEKGDMISILQNEAQQLHNQRLSLEESPERGKIDMQLVEHYAKLAAIDDIRSEQWSKKTESLADDALNIAEKQNDLGGAAQRLLIALDNPKCRKPYDEVIERMFNHVTKLHKKAKINAAHQLFDQLVTALIDRPNLTRIEAVALGWSMNGLLMCDHELKNKEQWPADIKRAQLTASKLPTDTLDSIYEAASIAEGMIRLGAVKEQVPIVARLVEPLKDGTFDGGKPDYSLATNVTIQTAAGFMYAKDYPSAYKLMSTAGVRYCRQSKDTDKARFRTLWKQWGFSNNGQPDL